MGANPAEWKSDHWVCPVDRYLETGKSFEAIGSKWERFSDWKNRQLWIGEETVPFDHFVKGAEIHINKDTDSIPQNAMTGLRLLVERHVGTSTDTIHGYWSNVGSGRVVSYTATETMALTTGKTMTATQADSYNRQLSAGFEATISGKVTVGSTHATTTATAVQDTMSSTRSETFTASCGSSPPEHGNWFIWQWNMDQFSDEFGPGFDMKSRHTVCTTGIQPRCPLGFCVDSECQTCAAPFDGSNNLNLAVGSSNEPLLSHFTLVNADTDQDVQTLSGTGIINVQSVRHFNIRAEPSETSAHIGSVVFWANGNPHRTENVAPYSLAGDNNGNYHIWPAVAGVYDISAQAFSEPGGGGTAGPMLTAKVEVTEGGPLFLTHFTLVNAENEQDMDVLEHSGITNVNRQSLPHFNLRADFDEASADIGSVVFWVDGNLYRTEGVAPYALAGDSGGDYHDWPTDPGIYEISAQAFSEAGGKGIAGPMLSATIEVLED